MNKFIQTLIILLFPLASMGALTVNNGGGATNITSTSAWITATIASTGAANPYLYSYWGTNNGGTNAASWGHTNSYGVCTQAAYSVQITGLSDSTIYYFRTHATNTYATTNSESAWATYSAQFITLTTPTSAPPSSVRAVTVDTNAMLKNPTNFFAVNSNSIISALSGTYSSESEITALQVATNNLSGRVAVVETGKVDRVDTNGWVVSTHSGLATGTPVYVEADAIATNMIEVASNHFEAVKLNTNDVSVTNARPWDSPNYNTITNPPAIPSTNDLASTNWVISRGYVTNDTGATNITAGASDGYNPTTKTLTWNTNAAGGGGSADLSAWSGYPATQAITWNEVVTNIYVGGPTNLLVTGWLTPDVTGMYTQQSVVADAPSYHNANGYYIYRYWEVEYYGYRLGTDTNGSCLWLTINDDPASVNWTSNGTTGTPTVVYFYGGLTNVVTNVWTLGLDAASGCMQKTRNGVVLQRWYANSNIANGTSYASDYQGFWYGLGTNAFYPYTANPAGYLTSMTLGITAGSAYDGAQGNYVSNLAAAAQANNILTSNAIPTTADQVGAYPNASGVAASNLAYAASTNAEAARVIATNAKAVADAALPASETNDLKVTALQVTGGSPTNGGLWECTNTITGQGKWSGNVGFHATLDSNFVFSNGIQRTVSFSTETFDVGNNFDLTSFVAPVNGIYYFYNRYFAIVVSGPTIGDSNTYINKNGSVVSRADFYSEPTAGNFGTMNGVTLLLTNGAVVTFSVVCESGRTNKLTGSTGLSYCGGYLIREIP